MGHEVLIQLLLGLPIPMALEESIVFEPSPSWQASATAHMVQQINSPLSLPRNKADGLYLLGRIISLGVFRILVYYRILCTLFAAYLVVVGISSTLHYHFVLHVRFTFSKQIQIKLWINKKVTSCSCNAIGLFITLEIEGKVRHSAWILANVVGHSVIPKWMTVSC